MTKLRFANFLVLYEFIGFTAVIIILWIDEILDLPHHLFGADPTPLNVVESIFESILVLFLMILVMTATLNIVSHLKYLEGFLRVCVSCNRIRTSEGWVPLDSYISGHYEVDISHGLCPDCAEKRYGIVSKDGIDI
jgi:hypothetical protein